MRQAAQQSDFVCPDCGKALGASGRVAYPVYGQCITDDCRSWREWFTCVPIEERLQALERAERDRKG